jgi:UDP-glucuronate 4-epimerase
MKIVVTGACGFIGFHATKKLLEEGHEVLGIDNLNQYYDVRLKLERLALLQHLGMQFLKADIADSSTYETISAFNPDKFLHLAAQAGVRYASQNPGSYFDSNLSGFFKVLEWVRLNKHVPLLYASSSSVYGNCDQAPFSEDLNIAEPESFYAATKRANELMAISYQKTFDITATGLRFFTVYGPYGRPDMAYFSFAKDIVEGRPIKVYHQGLAKRDFTYISDIVEGIMGALFCEKPDSIYNLGHSHPYTTLELIKIIEDTLGKKADIVFEEGPKGDVALTFADFSKAQKDFGFCPKIDLKEGMSSFLAYFMDQGSFIKK